ncbi:CBS domain-containing protein [Hyalangium sp.]|uniref:CBS domain-containing protein n=1 Tax=Hyalangium sp. TaxID=2028555 RepID=UPI002D73B015|nr:CBS domain-containing protein [Hyalangium sp.]HYI02892.1 CBS domain-containing protein [Hyalangium sp.]
MRCEELMKKDVQCVSPRDTVEDAAIRMRDENVGFLPVCDQAKKVLGTLTDRDIVVRVIAARTPANTPIETVMTREIVACRPQDDIQKAEQLMMQNHKSRIMCIDDSGRLVGVISLSDLAQHEDAARALDMLRRISEREVRA